MMETDIYGFDDGVDDFVDEIKNMNLNRKRFKSDGYNDHGYDNDCENIPDKGVKIHDIIPRFVPVSCDSKIVIVCSNLCDHRNIQVQIGETVIDKIHKKARFGTKGVLVFGNCLIVDVPHHQIEETVDVRLYDGTNWIKESTNYISFRRFVMN